MLTINNSVDNNFTPAKSFSLFSTYTGEFYFSGVRKVVVPNNHLCHCSICGEKFTAIHDLKLHQARDHPNHVRFSCPACYMDFKVEGDDGCG